MWIIKSKVDLPLMFKQHNIPSVPGIYSNVFVRVPVVPVPLLQFLSKFGESFAENKKLIIQYEQHKYLLLQNSNFISRILNIQK